MPISLDDHHLVLLMEESNEAGLELLAALLATGKRCSKQLRFGRDEVQPGQLLANHERLRGELLDVLACIRFLERSGQIERIGESDVDTHMQAKQQKIDAMIALSRSQGRLEQSLAEEIDRPTPPSPPFGDKADCPACQDPSRRT
jgi:hypothetical protein